MARYLTLLVILAAGVLAQAKITIISEKSQEYRPTGESSLIEFRLLEMKKKVEIVGLPPEAAAYQTDVRAVYSTREIKQIEDYAIVQFIKGCQFESEWDGHELKKTLTVYRNHFGKNVVFHHPSWVVDSDNADPVYSSFADLGRFAGLRWNTDAKSLDPGTAHYYADRKPEVSTVFVTDLPGSAMILSQEDGIVVAKNITLEFQTCLFRTSDVPKVSTPQGEGIDKQRALSCMGWTHGFVFDPGVGAIVPSSGIDPICR